MIIQTLKNWFRNRETRKVKLEKAILQAVRELGEGAYGYPVWQRVNEILNREVSFGAFYWALDRMEEKRWLGAYEMPGGAERNFRAKRYFYLSRNAPETAELEL